MSKALDKLMFTISLIDKVSGPAAKIGHQIDNLVSTAKAGFMNIGIGAAGLAGAGFAIRGLIDPAREFNQALAEVASLDVSDSALRLLGNTALNTSTELGISASEIAGSAYSIQSSIAGLSGVELSAFTRASAVLARGTLTDTSTITEYMGKMYGVFEETANSMGRSAWVEQMTGMTAQAVQIFRTDGAQMAAAFSSLGRAATSAGLGMAEQMAVLGSLQQTVSGSEAATKFQAFLKGIGKAQETLGLQFTDSAGNMLGVIPILEQLQGKFGETLTVQETDLISKAFGSKEAVDFVQLLMQQTDQLGLAMGQLGSISGMDKALQMAAETVDPWEQLGSSVEALKIGFGSALLPVLNPLVSGLTGGANKILEWMNFLPNITRYLGVAVATIIGLTGAMAGLTLITGLAKTAWAGMMVVKAVSMAFVALLPTLSTLKAAFLAVNIAMYANPLGLIVAGVAVLTVAVGALIYHWDSLKQAFLDSTFGSSVIGMIDTVVNAFRAMGGFVGSVIDTVISGLNLIPGININANSELATAPQVGSLDNRNTGVPVGGVGASISKAIDNSSNNKRVVQIGSIQTNQPAQSIEQELLMAGA